MSDYMSGMTLIRQIKEALQRANLLGPYTGSITNAGVMDVIRSLIIDNETLSRRIKASHDAAINYADHAFNLKKRIAELEEDIEIAKHVCDQERDLRVDQLQSEIFDLNIEIADMKAENTTLTRQNNELLWSVNELERKHDYAKGVLKARGGMLAGYSNILDYHYHDLCDQHKWELIWTELTTEPWYSEKEIYES